MPFWARTIWPPVRRRRVRLSARVDRQPYSRTELMLRYRRSRHRQSAQSVEVSRTRTFSRISALTSLFHCSGFSRVKHDAGEAKSEEQSAEVLIASL